MPDTRPTLVGPAVPDTRPALVGPAVPDTRLATSRPATTQPTIAKFKDIRDLKQLLLKDQRQIARNLVQQMLTYATGAPVRFGDRAQIEQILDHTAPDKFPVRSLIHEIVQSDLFRNK